MTNSAVRDSNAQLYTPAKAVLTISPDRFLLFARRLPIELEQ